MKDLALHGKSDPGHGTSHQGEFRRFGSAVLASILLLNSVAFAAAPDVLSQLASGTLPTAPAPKSGLPPRDTLIEVSVDSLEISETNTDVLGMLWGRTGSDGSVIAGQVNFLERAFPGIF